MEKIYLSDFFCSTFKCTSCFASLNKDCCPLTVLITCSSMRAFRGDCFSFRLCGFRFRGLAGFCLRGFRFRCLFRRRFCVRFSGRSSLAASCSPWHLLGSLSQTLSVFLSVLDFLFRTFWSNLLFDWFGYIKLYQTHNTQQHSSSTRYGIVYP